MEALYYIFMVLGVCVGSYLIGSIPIGVFVARYKNVDITKYGSGNIGGTNIGRTLGRKWGIFVGVCDAFKGSLPAIVTMYFLHQPDWLGALSFLFTALGGFYSIFLWFKGGKGVGVLIGGILILLGWQIWLILLGLAAFLFFLVAKGKVSLVSLSMAFGVIVFGFFLVLLIPAFLITGLVLIIVGALIWIKHKDNIKRLINNEEQPIFDQKKLYEKSKALYEKTKDKTIEEIIDFLVKKFRILNIKIQDIDNSKKPK